MRHDLFQGAELVMEVIVDFFVSLRPFLELRDGKALGKIDAVLLDNLPVCFFRVLTGWDFTRHVEEVTVPHIRHRELLNEPLR